MKKVLYVMSALAILISLAFASISTKEITVVIDAGHGGFDEGTRMDHFTEKDITASIAAKIRDLNTSKNIKIVFSRNGDEHIPLTDRSTLANNLEADLLLSLHVNSNPNQQVSGVELFIAEENSSAEKSALLAEKLKTFLETKNNFKVRGVKTAPFMILKNSKVPAINLQLGYLSNKQDAEYLTTDSGQQKIAESISAFIASL